MDAHCGVSSRCRGATAAGANFASETLFIYSPTGTNCIDTPEIESSIPSSKIALLYCVMLKPASAGFPRISLSPPLYIFDEETFPDPPVAVKL